MLEHVPQWLGHALRGLRAGAGKLCILQPDLGGSFRPIQLSSPAFADGGRLPPRFTADGEGVSPPLLWGPVPEGTHCLALIVEDPDAPLPVLTRWAIDRLKGHVAGFFLMIENEGTDSASHQNFLPDVQSSLTSFDLSVGIALDFAAARGDTLVVVTADHETGGLRINETKAGRPRPEWSTTDHTAGAVPVFAFGPGSATFAGFYDNTDVGKKLLSFVK